MHVCSGSLWLVCDFMDMHSRCNIFLLPYKSKYVSQHLVIIIQVDHDNYPPINIISKITICILVTVRIFGVCCLLGQI